MIPALAQKLLGLVLGTLYPAYASYKAVRTKNVREYVKWMMYWIVFAIFASVESFADIFVAFWFPFYYEVKILFLIWLISPVSRGSLGSSILYRRFVHPSLLAREDEIDRMIEKLQEQGYNTVTKLAVKAFNYVSNIVMQTAIRAPDLMNELIEAQRLEQNTLQRSSTDTTDNVEPRFVEVMDTDNENNFDEIELNDEIQREIVNELPKSPKKTKKKASTKKATKKSKTTKKNNAESIDLSSDSSGDPDFDPDMEVTGPSASTRMRTRNRSTSTSKKQ